MGRAISNFFNRRPRTKSFLQKIWKDNITMLASAVAWTMLTSLVPVLAGLVAIGGIFLHSSSAQQNVIAHLAPALAGALSAGEIQDLVKTASQHTGLLGLIGFLGVLWGGSNVGGKISAVFQPIFQVSGRDFFREKLIDIGMIFVFTALMLIVFGATTAGAVLDRLFSHAPLSGATTFALGTVIALVAAFLLFAVIYIVFPNTEPRFKLEHIWPGAAIAAVLFETLTFVFPLYTRFSHFTRYGAVLASILLLTAWIYFFSIILLIGAEFVSFGALQQARSEGVGVGPVPDGSAPQRSDFRQEPRREAGAQ